MSVRSLSILVCFLMLWAQVGRAIEPENEISARYMRFLMSSEGAKFVRYDKSAKRANEQLREYLKRKSIQLPLFPDLFANPPAVKGPKVCIAIQTAKRVNNKYINYINQLVMSLLTRANPLKDDFYIHIFSNTRNFSDLDLVEDLVPVTYLGNTSGTTNITGEAPQIREAFDHVFVLRTMENMKCQYTALFEDDAIVSKGWFNSVLLAASQVESRHSRDWFVVQLYSAIKFIRDHIPQQVLEYERGFGAVAILINSMRLSEYAQFVEDKTLEWLASDDEEVPAKDLYIPKFRKERELFIGEFEPSVVQHTGIFSSVNPQRGIEEFLYKYGMQSYSFQYDGVAIDFEESMYSV